MPKRLRILFVLPHFGRSGAVDFIVDLAGAMASDDCSVEILCLRGDIRATRQPPDSVEVTIASGEQTKRVLRFVPVRLIRKVLRTIIRMAKLIRSALRSDLIFLTWEFGPALLWPSLAAYILRKPTLAIVQNNVRHSLVDYSSQAVLRFIRWSYARTIAVVCVSHDLKTVLEEVGVSRNKLVAIPNAVDVKRIMALASQSSPKQFADTDIPFLVGVGRLSHQKGFDLLIRAHAEVLRLGLHHKLILIGNGPEERKLKALSAKLGVSASVSFPGYVPNPYPAMLQSSVCCMPSRYEGRSLVLTEAALLGVPIIATDCPTGPREVLAGGRYGELVKTESVEALTEAIKKHLQCPQRLIAKAKAAAQDFNRYSIESCAYQYMNLIHRHLN